MRLLNVYNLSFATFDDDEIPPYAIASHRWIEDEASYVDVLERRNDHSDGFRKIRGFCKFVAWRNRQIQNDPDLRGTNARLEWIWIDSCCIDRRSSQEISQNINSMYRYYEQAEECYAYLSDVRDVRDARDASPIAYQMMNSTWFTRAWTLQELLAPSRVLFISADWRPIGLKSTMVHAWPDQGCWACPKTRNLPLTLTLIPLISRITRIPTGVLQDPRTLGQTDPASICQWIQNRKAKMKEDLAYCLLGLLGVYMSPIYGEGDNAWSRLERAVQQKHGRACSLPRPTQLQSDDRDGDEGGRPAFWGSGDDSGDDSRGDDADDSGNDRGDRSGNGVGRGSRGDNGDDRGGKSASDNGSGENISWSKKHERDKLDDGETHKPSSFGSNAPRNTGRRFDVPRKK